MIPFKESTSDYWKSPEGIQRRVDMLGQDFCWRVVNNALQVYGRKNDVKGWLGIEGPSEHCEYCLAHIIGHFFRLGQFLPRLPAHNYCTCEWELVPREE